MARALFLLGRGPTARPLGSLYRATPAAHATDEPGPQALAALPIGQALVTATEPGDYTAAVADLLLAWRAGGFGEAYTRDEEQLANDVSPNVDGSFPGHVASPLPYEPDFSLAYAFDEGRVWLWLAGAWHTLTVTPGTSAGSVAVAVVPQPRRHGARYPDTARLDLPQLAVWLMAELVARAADPDTGLSPGWRYAAAVNPTRREIRFTVFGPRDEQQREYPAATAGPMVGVHAARIIDAHNWTNPTDARDHRFTHTVDTPTQAAQRVETERGRGPGTVTVIDTEITNWW